MGIRRLATAATLALTIGCGSGDAGPATGTPVMVFAAASLREVAVDLAAEFEHRRGQPVSFNFAGSNTLALQIRAAPRADAFLSADETWIRFVEKSGAAVAGSRRPFLANRLVAIARRDSPLDPADPRALAAAPFRRLALADPAAVPAGRYARAHLERAGDGVWEAVADRVVPAADVRAALALVESDPEILGIVYRTDVATADRVRVLFEFTPRDDLPIVYWAVALAGGGNPAGGRELVRFLGGPEAAEIGRRHGFSSLAETPVG